MNQTELPECEKINKKEPSKDVQMTQEQADSLVEHLKNIYFCWFCRRWMRKTLYRN